MTYNNKIDATHCVYFSFTSNIFIFNIFTCNLYLKKSITLSLPPLIHTRRLKPYQIKKFPHSGTDTFAVTFLNFFGDEVGGAMGFDTF